MLGWFALDKDVSKAKEMDGFIRVFYRAALILLMMEKKVNIRQAAFLIEEALESKQSETEEERTLYTVLEIAILEDSTSVQQSVLDFGYAKKFPRRIKEDIVYKLILFKILGDEKPAQDMRLLYIFSLAEQINYYGDLGKLCLKASTERKRIFSQPENINYECSCFVLQETLDRSQLAPTEQHRREKSRKIFEW